MEKDVMSDEEVLSELVLIGCDRDPSPLFNRIDLLNAIAEKGWEHNWIEKMLEYRDRKAA
jgi:hypothetical protein